MIQISQLSKAYGSRVLFQDMQFSMIAGERLGLVGRNGCGKSTLFRLILGEETPDAGNILFPRGYRVGHLEQHLSFTEPNILQEACLGLPEEERELTYKAEIILGGLGFSESDFARSADSFSGGFQIRINLAKLLLSEPNLLLLDEPTNYLDIVSMRWLSEFLRAWKGELIIISHDRMFMDSVTTHTMIIHRGGLRKVKGPTEKLYEQVALDEEVYERTRQNEERERKHLESFVNRFRAQASKAALVQSRIKMLEKLGTKEELVDEETLDFRFCESPLPGKRVGEVSNISFAYPNAAPLIENLSFVLRNNDRIGIIGKNGKGKSTLLRILAGELLPTAGSFTLGQNVKTGYFGQTNISRLNPKCTIEDEVMDANPALHKTKIRAICGTMMFSGDDALKKISVLSGGEKSRVLLGKILAQPTNFLLLDEPTNHLDMESIEALMESLETYNGAVVLVTHSELLLKRLVNRLVVFRENGPEMLEFGYDHFLATGGWGDEQEMSKSQASSEKPKAQKKEQDKKLQQLERRIQSIEERITRSEEKAKELETQLAEAYEGNTAVKVSEILAALEAAKKDVEEKFEELERLEGQKQEMLGVA